ncbi:MAG: trimethylamine methyltransferase family protein [Hyphomicrobiaceae bacterium]
MASDAAAGVAARARAGRSGRRAERARAPSGPAYIKRRIPPYTMLDEEALQRFDVHADMILKEVGIEVRDDAEALRLFKEAGADVKGTRVRFEPGHVRRLCATAPEVFTQHARNPARSVQIGGNATVFSPAYGSPFVTDLDKGRRYGSLADFENFVRLAYVSPWLHHSGGTVCEPVDIPVNKRHLDMVYAHIRWSDKAFMGSVTAAERARDSIDMARILFGADFVDRNCVILGNINVNSPLVWDGTMTGALRAYAEANQCAVVVPFILGGAMGPVTTAGALAQAYAEAMVGIALTQLVRPGAPAIFGNFLSSMSLKSGAPTFGMPEPSLAYFAFGALARRLKLPFRLGGGLTASKAVDMQAAQEAADTMMATMLSGANFVLHAAGWLEGALTMSYEKFVLDADHCGMMHRFAEGIALDDNGFAMDGFREVGPGSHFFGCSHTMANYETAFHEPELSDNQSFEKWQEMGSEDAAIRANRRWKEMLAAYEPPPLDPGIDEALKAFIAKRKEEMPDAWH